MKYSRQANYLLRPCPPTVKNPPAPGNLYFFSNNDQSVKMGRSAFEEEFFYYGRWSRRYNSSRDCCLLASGSQPELFTKLFFR